jgi:hypothetical protein
MQCSVEREFARQTRYYQQTIGLLQTEVLARSLMLLFFLIQDVHGLSFAFVVKQDISETESEHQGTVK